MLVHDAGKHYPATSVTGGGVTTRAVPGEEHDHYQHYQDDHDDPGHFHPAWCTRIGRPVTHVRLLSSQTVVEAFTTPAVYDTSCFDTRQNASALSSCILG